MSAVSLTAFSDLRRSLENGVVLLDAEGENLQEVINAMLDDAEMKTITTPDMREPILHLFDNPQASNVDNTSNSTKEGCKVYVAKLSFLKKPSIRIAAAMTQKTSTRSAFF